MDSVESGSDHESKSKIKIFIASSRELCAERERADAVLNSLHKIVDVAVEPVRWETDMPGGSVDTPTIQDKINELLIDCDPVIVLFYSKVGTFTLTELQLSLKMKKKIFVYFKMGYSPKNNDEFTNFRAVHELKESIKRDNRILIGEFDTIDRFENILSKDILKYLKENSLIIPPGKTDLETFFSDSKRIDSNRQAGTSHPLAGKKLKDLDQDRVTEFMKQERVIVEFFGKDIDTLERKFSYMHLLIEGKYLVKGAYLCFGKNIPEVCRNASPTKFFVYETTDISKPLINIAVDGNLLEQYFTILGHLKKNLYLIRDVYTREPEDYEIPLVVIQEMLANAIVHRDYGDDILSTIQVELYPDRLEIYNPGNFPDEISLDKLEEEISISLQRNIEISTVFFMYGIVERAGKGIRRIQDELKKKALTPAVFYQDRKSRCVKVTVKRKKIPGKTQDIQTSGVTLLTPLPTRRVKLIGRREEINALKELLENTSNRLVVTGLGGVGKTELCKHFFFEHYEHYAYAAWVEGTASIKESIISSVTPEIPGIRETDTPDERFKKVISYLKHLKGEVLLVFDNINDPNDKGLDTINLLPGNFKVIVISRIIIDGFYAFHLEGLNTEACLELFYQFYKSREGEDQVREIIKLAGNHPLTIELLARTAWNAALNVREFYNILKSKGFNINNIIPESVSTFWHESVVQETFFDHLLKIFDLSNISGKELHILANLSVLPAVNIHINDLSEWLNLDSHEDINKLISKGFITRHEFHIQVHPVVQEVIRYKASPGIDTCEDLILSIGNKLTLKPEDNPFDKRDYVHIAESILSHIQDRDESIANLANNLSGVYLGMGDIEKALEFQRMALAIKESIFDFNHPSLVLSYNNLSSIYNKLGKPDKALEFQQKALKIRETVLDRNHPDLAASYNNLSLIYQNLGQLDKALEYQLKTLAVFEKIYDKDHPSLATSYNNISTIYLDMGQWKKALDYQLKAIEIMGKVLATDHPNLGAAYNNVSMIYRNMGQLEKSLQYQLKTISIFEKIYDKDHPHLATSYNNISIIYRDMGQLEKALESQLKVLEIDKKTLYKDHPHLATSYNNVAMIYRDMDKLEEALKYAQKAVAILEKLFPNGHPKLDTARENLEGMRKK